MPAKSIKQQQEGMSLKDFKANRQKNKRRESSADAEKRGHVGKEWYNSGRKYSPDEAKHNRAKMDDEERRTRHRSAVDPDDEDDNNYSADKTKNPKKLRKQKAMGESMINEEDYDRMKDRRMERGGIDGNTRYPSKSSGGGGKKESDDEIRAKQKKALDMVRASIMAKHGAGSLLPSKKNEGYAPGDVDQKVGAVTAIPKSERDAARERILAKTAAKRKEREAMQKEETEKEKYKTYVVDIDQKEVEKVYQRKMQAERERKFAKTAAKRKELDKKEEVIHEDEYRKLMAQERKAEKDKEAARAGRKSITPGKFAASTGRDYADSNVKFHAKVTGKKTTTEGTFAGNYKGPLYAPHPDLINERGDFWHPDPEKDRKLGGPGPNQRAREDRADASEPKKDYSKTTKPGESYMDFAKRKKAETSKSSTKYPPEIQKRLDAAKAKKKEGIVGKIARKIGLKKEGFITYREFIAEGNRTGRMMQKSKTQVTGHISADRGDDEKKNREGRKTLEKDLKKHGIGHKKGVGEYKYGSGETGREVSYQTSKPDKMSKRRFGKVMRRMGRKHGQESVITKDKDKSAKLHYTEKGSKAKSDSIGKSKAGKHPEGYGETSGTKVRGGKLPNKTTKGAYHYG
jgi:hypothetical protein